MNRPGMDDAIGVLIFACALMGVQLVIITVALVGLRHDVRALLRLVSFLNYAINPWASETPTNPPRVRRAVRWGWLPRRKPPD